MNKKLVVIGGGHGLATMLRGIKQLDDLDISAIVTVADSGGSTGRIRKYYDIPAMGDLRNVLVAFACDETILKELLDYRFKGELEEDLLGHNLGNLILTALSDKYGGLHEGIKVLSDFLKVKGKIIPASNQNIDLFAKMDDGTIVKGESNIPNRNNRIKKVFYQEKVLANKEAVKAIDEADYIIYGIGSLFTSVLPIVIIDEIKKALKNSKAKKIYFCNNMTQPGETEGYNLEAHVDALIRTGVKVDCVIKAKDDIPTNLTTKYLKEGSFPVTVSRAIHDYQIYQYELLTFNDDYIRHDPQKIKDCIKEVLEDINNVIYK